MDDNILRADKKTRIVYLIIILVLVIAAFLIYTALQNYYQHLNSIAEDHPEEALTKVMKQVQIMIVVNPIIIAIFMLYFIILGVKTYQGRQFPPRGVKVIRDTKLVTGGKARKYAYGLWAVSVLLLIFAVMLTLLLNRFIQTLY